MSSTVATLLRQATDLLATVLGTSVPLYLALLGFMLWMCVPPARGLLRGAPPALRPQRCSRSVSAAPALTLSLSLPHSPLRKPKMAVTIRAASFRSSTLAGSPRRTCSAMQRLTR